MSNPLLPFQDISKTGWHHGEKVHWLFEYEKTDYEKQGNKEYSETDVVYDLNKHGYRCPSFDSEREKSILLIGDSYSFGYALPHKYTFGEIVRSHIENTTGQKTILWNLSFPGVSNDYICRTAHQAVPLLKPDLVILNFTTTIRREYIAVNGDILHYLPHQGPDWNLPLKECWKHMQSLTSSYQDELNFYLNYRSVSSLLRGTPWICAGIDECFFRSVEHIFEPEYFIGYMRKGDPKELARDNSHLGIAPNRDFAQRLAEFISRKQLLRNFTRSSNIT